MSVMQNVLLIPSTESLLINGATLFTTSLLFKVLLQSLFDLFSRPLIYLLVMMLLFLAKFQKPVVF